MDQLIFTPTKKALDSLERAIAQPKNEFTRDAVIQRFEYSFELTWKLLKRYLSQTGEIAEFNIKNLFREASKRGLIDSPEPWFDFLKARNLTSHTYNESTAEETYQAALLFAQNAKKLIDTIEKQCQ